jgi:enoyl-CoA hydratase/carnithine racemase/predicted RNase H-like HicB family nuclease
MLIEYFLERSRIELAANGHSYRGFVPELPGLQVSADTPEECRHKLEAAVTALFMDQDHIPMSGSENGASEYNPNNELVNTVEQIPGPVSKEMNAVESGAKPAFSDIIYEKKDWVARVTINRSEAYNAYTDHTLREMTAAFRDAASDNSIAVLVLTGAGDRAFSVGGDVQQHVNEHLENPEAFQEWIEALLGAHAALRHLGKPSIARINGMVAGGGNDWNLACDLAIAADHVKFVQIETKVGLISAAAASHWLPVVIGERRAREIFLTGEPVSANKALLWGLVNDVVPYKQLDRAVAELCQKLIDRFPESTRLMNRQIGFWKDLVWYSIRRSVSEDLPSHFSGDESREGLIALGQKRQVDYREFRLAVQPAHNQEPLSETQFGRGEHRLSRVCYSCGAQDLPESYEYCGLCGTRLV